VRQNDDDDDGASEAVFDLSLSSFHGKFDSLGYIRYEPEII
jgi:hypothetical protein